MPAWGCWKLNLSAKLAGRVLDRAPPCCAVPAACWSATARSSPAEGQTLKLAEAGPVVAAPAAVEAAPVAAAAVGLSGEESLAISTTSGWAGAGAAAAALAEGTCGLAEDDRTTCV